MTLDRIKTMVIGGAAVMCAASCVYIDDNLGQNFIPGNQIYVVKTNILPLTDICMGYSDSLSAYSSSRITVGSLKDGNELTSRSSAFTVVPVVDTIDVGENTKIIQFHFTAARDTTSVADESQTRIFQNIYVHRLKHVLDSTFLYTTDLKDEDFLNEETITRGIPVYDGGDSLSFDFSDKYAGELIDLFREDPDIQMDLDKYLEKVPGIYIRTDRATSEGGRINMFGCPIKISDSYYVTGNYAELKIRADYGSRKQVDTSFLFYFGPKERTTTTDQYAFNICENNKSERSDIIPVQNNKTRSQLYTTSADGDPSKGSLIFVEGGSGLKPVISAKGIKSAITAELESNGLSPENVIINKATLVLSIDRSDNYDLNYLLPDILSPTCKFSYMTKMENVNGQKIRYVTYAGLTDASVESENQGDVNLSLSKYTPDISHHVQEILRSSEDTLNTGRYDIWLLVMENAVVTTTNESQQEMSEYYKNLAYASYYNSLYGGYGYGYGYGYGGYGYSDYYNNYYNYMMAAQYASASATTEESVVQLDKDKFYKATLFGPGAADESLQPKLNIVYSYIPDKSKKEE